MYNILVCDDDKEIVDAIEIYLTQEGYHVLKAYDGMQAIQMLEREEIQLLIIDGKRAVFRSLFCPQNQRMWTKFWD